MVLFIHHHNVGNHRLLIIPRIRRQNKEQRIGVASNGNRQIAFIFPWRGSAQQCGADRHVLLIDNELGAGIIIAFGNPAAEASQGGKTEKRQDKVNAHLFHIVFLYRFFRYTATGNTRSGILRLLLSFAGERLQAPVQRHGKTAF